MLNTITNSPYLILLSALILFITSGYETIHTLNDFTLSTHHGILVFSIIQIIKVIPEIMHGLQEIEDADEIMEKRLSN
ncbi:hypothetical protein SAMN03080615_02681 [Amphritea atlantica]|uniref:Uncharacterized protein n=1 Tax=Amphritea atlantica TaxID=355243 RepID=A0A1H9IPP1_9GAMM|nr:hypothetical protein [Amphritea atlantica]SEQ76355.1 hypothetical protein SAMN03080615_02681 [Amphritea atlantica]